MMLMAVRKTQGLKRYILSGVLLSGGSGIFSGWAQALPGADTVKIVAHRSPFIFGAYAQGAGIIAHSGVAKSLATPLSTGLELNVQRQTTGTAPWHGWYKYPKAGLALVYYNYHHPALGHSYAATVYLSKALLRTARHDLSWRLGTGLAYFTQPYDPATNPDNTFIGSALSATLQTRLEYEAAMSPHWGLLVALALNHYSNGGTSYPNLGLNLPTLLLGINYHQVRAALPPPAPDALPADVGHAFFSISTSLGYRQRGNGDPTRYLVNSVTLAAGRRLNRKSNVLLGLEGFYDRARLADARAAAGPAGNPPDVKRVGIFAGHELLFGRLALATHLGLYVYSPYRPGWAYYERVGIKYQFTRLLFGAIDLKAHGAVADVVEFKAGIKL